jgi:uncharacterized protein YndB with AHSA1/START domain
MTTDGTYQEIDGQPALVFERRLDHPVDAVWQAVTDPDELKHWFPANVTVDLRDGGEMTFTFPDDQAPPSSGQVTHVDPPRAFEFTWGEATMRFDLEPAGVGCRLRFTHFLDDRASAARDAAGWHVCLSRLTDRLEGGDADAPTGEPTDEWRALYDKYVDAGLPAGAPVPD